MLLLTAITLISCDKNVSWDVVWLNQSIESVLSKVYQKAVENGFTGVVLVRHQDKILLHEAAGMANREQKIPNTTDTVFDMASITKQYTAALIMALQEAGFLTVEDRLSDFFNGIAEDKANITIHQLLTHTSGFRRNFGGDTVAINREVFLSLAWATRLDYEPGTKYQYSNAGYGIAAAIAEIASGQSYEAALKKYILDPAKLEKTGYLLPDWSKDAIAIGYANGSSSSMEDTKSWWADDGPYWHLRGSGGLRTTAGDLLKWHDELSRERVFSRNSIELLQGRHVDMALGADTTDESETEYYYGYGWITQDEPPVGVLHWHTGGSPYFKAFFGRAIDEELVIIALANERNGVLQQMVDDLGEAVVRAK